jgi:hypothetical protein
MLRTLLPTLALASVLACGSTPTASSAPGDGGHDASGSSGGSSSGGSSGGSSGSSSSGSSSGSGSTADGGDAGDGSVPACVLQSCGGGCCAGTYCWAFSNVCLQNGTCPGAGVDMPMPGLCSCDGFPAGSCPAGEVCPPPVHGHATYYTPGDAGAGALGSPCTSDGECAGGLCLGGAFVGGYCTNAVSECNPGLCANASVSCEGYGGFQDIDGGAVTAPEICPATCQTPAECRSGYECCPSNAGGAGLACLPPSMCPDH